MTPAVKGFLLSLSLCLDIGIVNIAMMTLAMRRGYWPGVCLGLGSAFGDLLYAIVALAGMTALLQFAPVRWVMWLGGTVVLLILAIKTVRTAWSSRTADASPATENQPGTPLGHFLKGLLLALSSPSAIIWFAAIGGSLIAQSGIDDWLGTTFFLAGFLAAGIVWTVGICFAAAQGGKVFGHRALTFCHIGSAVLFVYFAGHVAWSGYRTLILGGPA
jgi:L-lysine exporter family protein LysE/ArgO